MTLTKNDFIKEIENMTVLELNDLVEALKEKFGVTGMPAVMAQGVASGGDEGVAKSVFDIILKNHGGNKIAVIKEIKIITGLGLKEAKEFVDNPQKALKQNVDKAEAEEIKKRLEAAGAEIELK